MKYILLFLFTVTSYANQRIELKASASLKEGKVLLKDVAKIEGFSSESQELLDSVILVPDLKIGELRKLSDQFVTDVLRRKLHKIKRAERKASKDFNLVLKLPKIIELFVNSPIWTKKEITKLIIDSNKEFCKECSFKFDTLILPKSNYAKVSRWEMQKPDEFIKGNFQIPLKVFYHQKEKSQTFYINGKLTTYKKMPVARRNISPGDRLVEKDILWEKRKWNFVRKDLANKDELVGAKVKRTILSGGILWLSNLEREKAIRRGDLIDIIVKKTDWEIRMKGVAQKDGVLGDTVPVLNRRSKKVLMGKIVDKQEVVLQ